MGVAVTYYGCGRSIWCSVNQHVQLGEVWISDVLLYPEGVFKTAMESSTVAKIKQTQLSTPKFAVPCTSKLVEDSIVLLALPYSLVDKHMRLSLSMVRKYYVPVR